MNGLIFIVKEDPAGGYQARAVGESIFTESDTLEELYRRVCDAAQCHFNLGQNPTTLYLHFIRGNRSDLMVLECDSIDYTESLTNLPNKVHKVFAKASQKNLGRKKKQ